ncbi:MAG: tetratricopeptide repeat protein, partial [Pseudobdellovibrionaceae bacterium]|nr:tetratricopeptide repeat protein [Pseudobdellovibrionaceae bacterium]
PERLILMGDALYGKGDLDKAMACYQEAIDIDPSVKDIAHKQMGQVHLATGKVEEALELFKGSMSEEESAGFFNNAAVHAVREGKIEEAITLYNTALKALVTDKLKPFIYFNLALSHRRLGQAEDAVKCLKRALHYNPGYEKARVHLDSILKPVRKLQKAS